MKIKRPANDVRFAVRHFRPRSIGRRRRGPTSPRTGIFGCFMHRRKVSCKKKKRYGRDTFLYLRLKKYSGRLTTGYAGARGYRGSAYIYKRTVGYASKPIGIRVPRVLVQSRDPMISTPNDYNTCNLDRVNRFTVTSLELRNLTTIFYSCLSHVFSRRIFMQFQMPTLL